MILDHVDYAAWLHTLHPVFREAFDFLGNREAASLPTGKHKIRGDEIYAVVMREKGRAREKAPLEAHRKYIDIQAVIEGVEEMGWKPLAKCRNPDGDYNPAKDILFFKDTPDTWFKVSPGQFAVFYPWDAHAPLVSEGPVHKIVIKVAVTDRTA